MSSKLRLNNFKFTDSLFGWSAHFSLQTHHVDSTLKRRGNGRFHVVSMWNPHVVFVEFFAIKIKKKLEYSF